mmetsp:Transcript_60218/g.138144  ORF Transcript_60218/g.138144 Transcript_60218/m.138144 type:complete len:211 (+) Transcript_60218:325-957(+)
MQRLAAAVATPSCIATRCCQAGASSSSSLRARCDVLRYSNRCRVGQHGRPRALSRAGQVRPVRQRLTVLVRSPRSERMRLRLTRRCYSCIHTLGRSRITSFLLARRQACTRASGLEPCFVARVCDVRRCSGRLYSRKRLQKHIELLTRAAGNVQLAPGMQQCGELGTLERGSARCDGGSGFHLRDRLLLLSKRRVRSPHRFRCLRRTARG